VSGTANTGLWRPADSLGSFEPDTCHSTVVGRDDEDERSETRSGGLNSRRYNSAYDLETTLHSFASRHDEHLPQGAPDPSTPTQIQKKRQSTCPDLFSEWVANQLGR
jgi:hypothetical protein